MAEELHRVWHKVEELDLALVRTALMRRAVQPNCRGDPWLPTMLVGLATAAGLEPFGPGSAYERNLTCSATITGLTFLEKYLYWK